MRWARPSAVVVLVLHVSVEAVATHISAAVAVEDGVGLACLLIGCGLHRQQDLATLHVLLVPARVLLRDACVNQRADEASSDCAERRAAEGRRQGTGGHDGANAGDSKRPDADEPADNTAGQASEQRTTGSAGGPHPGVFDKFAGLGRFASNDGNLIRLEAALA
jgi:hypothetical protein